LYIVPAKRLKLIFNLSPVEVLKDTIPLPTDPLKKLKFKFIESLYILSILELINFKE